MTLEDAYEKIIAETGEDPQREGLIQTPKRAAKAFRYLTAGYQMSLDEIVNNALFSTDNDDMVIVRDIELYSTCEHHLLPFVGKAHVAYVSNGKIIGLSKIARIVDMFARRLQVQESLTRQIADAVMKATGAQGVGVVVEAKHLCMMSRGVAKQNSTMSTAAMLGVFMKDHATRAEFLNLIRNKG